MFFSKHRINDASNDVNRPPLGGRGRGGKDDDGDDIDGNEGGSDVIIFSPELVVGESPADVVSRSGCPSQFQPEMEIMMKVLKRHKI